MAKRKKILIIFGLVLIIFLLGFGGGYLYFNKRSSQTNQPENINEKSVYIKFLGEAYDKIQTNYWEKISSQELSNIFYLGTKKLIGNIQSPAPKNKKELEKFLSAALKNKPPEEKEKICLNLINIVLKNLKPTGRNLLYQIKDEKNLKNRVENRNLKTGKIEPTVSSKIISPSVSYLQIKRFSPTTLDELQKAAMKVDVKGGKTLNSLILDLRGNIGGSMDILPYLLGPFIGNDQYAYEFYHQGERAPFKTKTGWLNGLVRYKKVVVLIDNNTQSTAELMASVLKKYNVGVLVGKRTRGWGTVERVFPLENQISPQTHYSLFLVHSLTLGDDNQPIEERGVEPVININNSNWPEELFAYFSSPGLIKNVKEVLAK